MGSAVAKLAKIKKKYNVICHIQSILPGLKTALGQLCVEWNQKAIITKENRGTSVQLYSDNEKRLRKFTKELKYFCEGQGIPIPTFDERTRRPLPEELLDEEILVLVEKSDEPRIASSGQVQKYLETKGEQSWQDDRDRKSVV